MHISGTNRFAHMQNIRRNEDPLNHPANKSSINKAFLYTTLAAAGLGAAAIAYNSGLFSSLTPPPSNPDKPNFGQGSSTSSPFDTKEECPFDNTPHSNQNFFDLKKIFTDTHTPIASNIEQPLNLDLFDTRLDNTYVPTNTNSSLLQNLEINNALSGQSKITNAQTPDKSNAIYSLIQSTPLSAHNSSNTTPLINDHTINVIDYSSLNKEITTPIVDSIYRVSDVSVSPITLLNPIQPTNTSDIQPIVNGTITPPTELNICPVDISSKSLMEFFYSSKPIDTSDLQQPIAEEAILPLVETDVGSVIIPASDEKPFTLITPKNASDVQPIVNRTVTPKTETHLGSVDISLVSDEKPFTFITPKNASDVQPIVNRTVTTQTETHLDPVDISLVSDEKPFILITPKNASDVQPIVNKTNALPTDQCPLKNG